MYQDDDTLKPEGEMEESFSGEIFDEVDDFADEPSDLLDEEGALFAHAEHEEDELYDFLGDEDDRDGMY